MNDDLRLSISLAADEPEAGEALRETFFKFAQPLIQFARRFSLDKETAEDAVHKIEVGTTRTSGIDLSPFIRF